MLASAFTLSAFIMFALTTSSAGAAAGEPCTIFKYPKEADQSDCKNSDLVTGFEQGTISQTDGRRFCSVDKGLFENRVECGSFCARVYFKCSLDNNCNSYTAEFWGGDGYYTSFLTAEC